MVNLYVTADRIGMVSGGGIVTLNEYQALSGLGETHPFDRERVDCSGDPFAIDGRFHDLLAQAQDPRLQGGVAHFYAGCFSRTVEHLKSHLGMKVTYTAAAHDVKLSREEHLAMGLPFDYPHLNDEELWKKYLAGYRLADLVICPSWASAHIMQGFGCSRVAVIPHGVELPASPEPPPRPKRFAVGYFGAIGPDKGLRYLLEAWKKLAYKDATLVLGGRATAGAGPLVDAFGGGNVEILGEVEDLADFYKRITVYCQPSVTEGFGIEVLEAMAYGRPVIATAGAGAADLVTLHENGWTIPIRSPNDIASCIEGVRNVLESDPERHILWRAAALKTAEKNSWAKIRALYHNLWSMELRGQLRIGAVRGS